MASAGADRWRSVRSGHVEDGTGQSHRCEEDDCRGDPWDHTDESEGSHCEHQ